MYTDDTTSNDWKKYFTIGSCLVQSAMGRAAREGFMVVRNADGVPIASGMYDYNHAVQVAKRFTIKLEKRLENILLG